MLRKPESDWKPWKTVVPAPVAISAAKLIFFLIYAWTKELNPLILESTSNSCWAEIVNVLLSGTHLCTNPTAPTSSSTFSPTKNWLCTNSTSYIGKWFCNINRPADWEGIILPGVWPAPINPSGNANSIYAFAPPIWPLAAVISHNS